MGVQNFSWWSCSRVMMANLEATLSFRWIIQVPLLLPLLIFLTQMLPLLITSYKLVIVGWSCSIVKTKLNFWYITRTQKKVKQQIQLSIRKSRRWSNLGVSWILSRIYKALQINHLKSANQLTTSVYKFREVMIMLFLVLYIFILWSCLRENT
jgi:hypothetical protein